MNGYAHEQATGAWANTNTPVGVSDRAPSHLNDAQGRIEGAIRLLDDVGVEVFDIANRLFGPEQATGSNQTTPAPPPGGAVYQLNALLDLLYARIGRVQSEVRRLSAL